LFSEMKDAMIAGVNGTLKGQSSKVPTDKQDEFNGYVDALMGPLEKAKNLSQFIGAMTAIAKTKDNIIKRLEIQEAVVESKAMDWLKSIKNKTIDWWNENKYKVALTIAELFVQILVELLFTILRALTKSSIDSPRIKFDGFGGGKFSGGGAGQKF